MRNHINKICSNATLALRRISKIRPYLNKSTTEILVHAFVSSLLDNCNSLFYGLPDKDLSKLQRIQNSAARLVTKKGKFEHVSPLLQDLHWLPIKCRIKFKVLVIVFQCMYGSAPEYLKVLIQPYNPQITLRSQSKNLLVPVYSNTKSYGGRAFQKIAPDLWNSLPQHLRDETNFDTFKVKLKTHLFNL